MNKELICSREYKIMLDADLFTGSESNMLDKCHDFWLDFKSEAEDAGAATSGNIDKVCKNRTVEFLDTANKDLRSNNYVLRKRSGKTTLKFRSGDRFLSEDRNMKAKNMSEKLKFEEDIVPVFASKFTFSSKIDSQPTMNDLCDVDDIWTDLDNHLPNWSSIKNDSLSTVGRVMNEKVIDNSSELDFSGVIACCSITVWYDKSTTVPAVVEFSFNYQKASENYNESICKTAMDIFDKLQALSSWIDPNSMTKTAYVYSI